MKRKEGRLQPLTVYLIPEEAELIRAMAEEAGVDVSLFLRQKLKRLLPLDVCGKNINVCAGKPASSMSANAPAAGNVK